MCKNSWTAYSFQITGGYHIQSGQSCEDVVCEYNSDEFLFIGIADGQSEKKYCKEGARLALSSCWGALQSQAWSELRTDQKQIGIIIKNEIEKALFLASEAIGEDVSEFSSTLIALIICKKAGLAIVIHIGDGIIGCVKAESQRIQIISKGEYSDIWKRSPTLTTTPKTIPFVEILDNLDDFTAFFAYSDGAKIIFPSYRFPHSVENMIKSGHSCESMTLLREHYYPVDDASLIVIEKTVEKGQH